MKIYKILVPNDTTYDLATTIENVDGLEAALSNLEGKLDQIVPIFIGTTEQYKAADEAGQVAVGTLVIITDDNGASSGGDNTTSKLGEAILGYMILGNT